MKNALRLPADRVHSYTTSWDVTLRAPEGTDQSTD